MTAFYPPDTIEALRVRAKSEPCTCVVDARSPDDIRIDPCLRCLVVSLQPTVDAFERPF